MISGILDSLISHKVRDTSVTLVPSGKMRKRDRLSG